MTRRQAHDVESYVVARWPDLVRTLVALGATVAEAEGVARAACARAWGSWRREQRSGDVDVLVLGELLRGWGWPHERPERDAEEVACVLVTTARVSEHVAEQVTGAVLLDPPLTGWEPDEERYVGRAPVEDIRDDVGRRRRRTTVRVTAVGLVVAVVAGLVLLLGRGPERPPEQANPLPLAWWGEGVLHLAHGEVEVPDLVELAQVVTEGPGTTGSPGAGAGVVLYSDASGGVHQVDGSGEPVRVGRVWPGSGLGTTGAGRAAWVDLGGDGVTVVVWDAVTRRVVDALPLSATPRDRLTQVVAMDGDTVHLRSPAGSSRWVVGEGTATPEAERVVTAVDGVAVVADTPGDPGSGAVVSTGQGGFTVPADHRATLSADGLVAAAWVPGEPDLTLVGAGVTLTTVPLDLPERGGILDVRLAPGGELVLVTSPPGTGAGAARVALVTCLPYAGTCVESATSRAPVVLAR